MHRPRVDAVSVVAADLRASVAFYALLGFEFPPLGGEDKHIEPKRLDNEARLMIDDRGLMTSILGQAPTPPSHSTFALACASANEVDALVKRIGAAGHTVKKAPWDAFWGQRYAIVADPDGYMVDLFAPL